MILSSPPDGHWVEDAPPAPAASFWSKANTRAAALRRHRVPCAQLTLLLRPSGSETMEKTRVRFSLSYRGAQRSFTAVKGGDPWKSPPGCQGCGAPGSFCKTTAPAEGAA